MHGMEVIHARRIPTHGGSIRVYAARAGKYPVCPSVATILEEESRELSPEKLGDFRARVVQSKLDLYALLRDIKARGQRIYGIGCPSRTSTLINYVGLDDGILDCVLEIKGSYKIGKYVPGTLIPVVEESRLFDDQPEFAMLLSWHIADELMPKLSAAGSRVSTSSRYRRRAWSDEGDMTASDLPPDDSPGMRPLRHFPIVRTLTVVLLFVYALSAFVPWKPFFPDNELDSSWLLALHWARLHRLDFGHEFVLTYGPWGFILRGYHPQTFGLVVLGWSFYSIVFFAALVQLSKRLTTKPWLVALWIAIVIALAGVSLQGLEDPPDLPDLLDVSAGSLLLRRSGDVAVEDRHGDCDGAGEPGEILDIVHGAGGAGSDRDRSGASPEDSVGSVDLPCCDSDLVAGCGSKNPELRCLFPPFMAYLDDVRPG